MAVSAHVQVLIGGAAIIWYGLLVPGGADKVYSMSGFLSMYFSSLMVIVTAYWGIGAYESKPSSPITKDASVGDPSGLPSGPGHGDGR